MAKKKTRTAGLSEPPEAVVRGESVPTENSLTEMERAKIDEAVGVMKAMPCYSHTPEDRLREIAKEKLL